MDHPQLRRLKIHRYEQFVDVPWIEFSPHENLILGINGAGKTRLLELIEAVLDFNYSALAREDLDVEFEMSFPSAEQENGVVTARGRVTSRYQPSHTGRRHRADVEGTATHFTARVEMRHSGGTARTVIDGAEGVVYVDDAEVTAGWRLFASRAVPIGDLTSDHGYPLDSFVPAAEPLFVHADDREFAELTEEVEYQLEAPGEIDYSGTPSLYYPIAALTDSWSPQSDGDRSFERCLGRDSTLLAHGAEAELSLGPLLEPIAAQTLTARPRILEVDGDRYECEGIELRLRFTSGVEVVDSRLTFGQRRFLLMALMLLSTAHYPILIDEIDNGLHPRLLESAFKLLPGRQSFLVSHNKTVVDLLNYSSAEDLRQRIHVCRRDEAGKQTVDTLTEATARDIFEKISVGIMHPSDVLLVEGLW